MGGVTPYVYSEIWDKLAVLEWTSRQISHYTATSQGMIFFDGTRRLNEFAVGSYFSPAFLSTDHAFTRVKGVQGSQIAGVQFVGGGLLVSDQHNLVFIGEHPPMEGNDETQDTDAGEVSREELQIKRSGGEK